mgnify:CR=1 FL=1
MTPQRNPQLNWAVTITAIVVAVLVPRLLGLDGSFAERVTWGILFGTLAIVLMNLAIVLYYRNRQ